MDRDSALGILDDLDAMDRPVTKKEADFIDSMMKQLEADPSRKPTFKQAAWLERLATVYLDR